MVPDQRGGTDFSRTSWKTPAETWPQTAQLQQFWLDHAINGLRRSNPESSASSPLARWQRQGLAVTAVLIPILFFLSAHFTWLALQALFALPFFLIVLVRLLAIWELAWHSPASFEAGPPLAVPQSLPAYSVLVALYDETAVADVLVRALAALDYPQDKLEILFVTEADDHATRNALESSGMADNMHIIIVPKGAPQTKPRALNYALSFSSGELIAVFDAEDIPESNQLRRAVHAFEAGGSDLACVQAHLNIYNAGKNAITRLFALEYTALFDCILPALVRLGLPLPLGGTSNHFRRAALEQAGAWDPFNVTEDADLGIRLARAHKRVEVLPSTTWEEAPGNARSWLDQRTRWLKGWMQTYLVHMRSPRALWRDLGAWRFLGFQVLMGGMVLAALVHPLFYIVVIAGACTGDLFIQPRGTCAVVVWWLCWFNLAASYASAIVLAILAARRRGHGRFSWSALFLPLYWLAISIAAYRALVDLVKRPHYWAKTEHVGLVIAKDEAPVVASD